jgi:hypothetical protein
MAAGALGVPPVSVDVIRPVSELRPDPDPMLLESQDYDAFADLGIEHLVDVEFRTGAEFAVEFGPGQRFVTMHPYNSFHR